MQDKTKLLRLALQLPYLQRIYSKKKKKKKCADCPQSNVTMCEVSLFTFGDFSTETETEH